MTAASRHRVLLTLRLLFAAVIVLAFAWFVRGLEVGELWRDLREAALIPVLVAVALNFVHMAWKALRWRIMLNPVRRIPLSRLYRYTVANYAASTILPARFGELVRVWLLNQREGISATTASAVAIAEKALDAVAMLMVAAPIPYLLPGLPSSVVRTLEVLTGVAVFAMVDGWLILWWADRSRTPPAWLVRFAAGIDIWRRPGDLALAALVSLGAWVCDVAVIVLLFHALGLAVRWPAALLILLTLNIAIAVPSTPASVGAFEIGAVVALDLLGVPRSSALAFALVYHAVQVVPLALIGVAELPLIWRLRAVSESEGGLGGVQPPAVEMGRLP